MQETGTGAVDRWVEKERSGAETEREREGCRTGERDVQRRERGDARLRRIYICICSREVVERVRRGREREVQGGERGRDRAR